MLKWELESGNKSITSFSFFQENLRQSSLMADPNLDYIPQMFLKLSKFVNKCIWISELFLATVNKKNQWAWELTKGKTLVYYKFR